MIEQKSRHKIVRLAGIGLGIWIIFTVVYSIILAIVLKHNDDPKSAWVQLILGIYAIGIFGAPLIALGLLVVDMINIIRDAKTRFVNKEWYIVLSVFAIFSVIISGIGFGTKAAILPQFSVTVSSIAGESNSVAGTNVISNSTTPNGVEIDLQKYTTYVGLALISMTFLLTGYIILLKVETKENKHQVALASDIFKTIFGFLTGVVAAALKSR